MDLKILKHEKLDPNCRFYYTIYMSAFHYGQNCIFGSASKMVWTFYFCDFNPYTIGDHDLFIYFNNSFPPSSY